MTTGIPRLSRLRTTAAPMKPAPPVTRNLILALRGVLVQARPGRGRSRRSTSRGDTHFRPQGGCVLADARCGRPAILAEAVDPKGQARRANRLTVGPEDSLENVHLLERLACKQRGPVENFGAPDVCELHAIEPIARRT